MKLKLPPILSVPEDELWHAMFQHTRLAAAAQEASSSRGFDYGRIVNVVSLDFQL